MLPIVEPTGRFGLDAVIAGTRRGVADSVRAVGVRKAAFVTVCAIVLSVVTYLVFLKRSGELVGAHGNKPSVVVLDGATTIGQSFRAKADGLDAVTLRIGRMDSPLNADLQCELLQVENGVFRQVYRWVDRVALPSSGGEHRFAFTPVRQSREEVFRFLVRSSGSSRRIPIEASMDNAFDAGAMIVNDREEWGDLVFETGAMASTTFGYFRMIATELPPMLRPAPVQIFVLAIFIWAWLSLVYWLFVARPEPL